MLPVLLNFQSSTFSSGAHALARAFGRGQVLGCGGSTWWEWEIACCLLSHSVVLLATPQTAYQTRGRALGVQAPASSRPITSLNFASLASSSGTNAAMDSATLLMYAGSLSLNPENERLTPRYASQRQRGSKRVSARAGVCERVREGAERVVCACATGRMCGSLSRARDGGRGKVIPVSNISVDDLDTASPNIVPPQTMHHAVSPTHCPSLVSNISTPTHTPTTSACCCCRVPATLSRSSPTNSRFAFSFFPAPPSTCHSSSLSCIPG